MLMNVPYFQNYAYKHPITDSRIILTKIATYYSQNYAGILGSSLLVYHSRVHKCGHNSRHNELHSSLALQRATTLHA